MRDKAKIIVSSLIWGKKPGGLHLAQAEAIQQLGYEHHFFGFDEAIPTGTNIVLVQGPYGSLLPLVRQLTERPHSDRPLLAYWFQQSLSLSQPERINKFSSEIFSELHRIYKETGLIGKIIETAAPSVLKTKGKRLGFLGDIQWLYRHNLLDVFALSSTFYADYLQEYGIPSIVVPRGYHPSYGTLLNLDREIAAVWMGKIRTKRRAKALYWLKEQLEKRGQSMHIYDGEKNGFIFGKKRTEILNKAWFVLNVFFSGPTDELSIRFFVAAANGAVIITEPGANKYPFIPGKHLLECSIKEMPDTIIHYIDNKDKWQNISQNMLRLIKNEITLENSIATILGEAEKKILRTTK